MGVRYGQVFLKDQNIIDKILASLSSDHVSEILEIGCGEGILTEALLTRCDRLHVIEIDAACIQATKARLGDLCERVTFHHQDVLTSQLSDVCQKPLPIVANVPYYLSAKLIKWMAKQRDLLQESVLMFQLEVVDKFCAKAGQDLYTSLSVFTQFYFEVLKLFNVSRHCFRPVPNVESAVLRIVPRVSLADVDRSVFFAMVRSCFWARRKMLKRALLDSPYLSLDPSFVKEDGFDVFSKKRGEVLEMGAFLRLYEVIKSFVVSVSSDVS
ncbi:MAG: 16S rRNA (adenine(1518)-N(6)/adenine(1519)-N(6))-dimethyltransferase RsmA [bacterium]